MISTGQAECSPKINNRHSYILLSSLDQWEGNSLLLIIQQEENCVKNINLVLKRSKRGRKEAALNNNN